MDPTRKSAPGLGSVSRRVGADIRQLTQEARLQTEGQAPPPPLALARGTGLMSGQPGCVHCHTPSSRPRP